MKNKPGLFSSSSRETRNTASHHEGAWWQNGNPPIMPGASTCSTSFEESPASAETSEESSGINPRR